MAENSSNDSEFKRIIQRNLHYSNLTKIKFSDFSLIFQIIWNNLFLKLMIAGSVVTLSIFIFSNLLGDRYREFSKIFLYISEIILFTVIIFSIFQSIISLLNTTRKAVEDLEISQYNNIRRTAQIEALTKSNKTFKNLFDSNSAIYGISIEKNSIDIDIKRDGAADLAYSLVINATQKGIQSIGRYSVNSNKYEKTFDEKDFPIYNYVYSGSYVILQPKIINSTENSLMWAIQADPGFPVNTPVPYKYNMAFSNQTFSMTESELKNSSIDFEYFQHTVSYPTKQIFITIKYPSNYYPSSTDFMVWSNSMTQVENTIERNRIKSASNSFSMGKQKSQVILSLHVDYPLIGHTYGIRWLPSG